MMIATRWRGAWIATISLLVLGWALIHPAPPAAAGQPITAPQQPAAVQQAAPSSRVHLFYYPWYGSPAVYGSYRHWQQGEHTPPDDIGANLYPRLGAYDSGDYAGAVRQHMAWVRQSGAGVIVYSWWGQGSYEDQLVAGVLAEASQQGVKVAWHLEPYQGRTAASTVDDINYLNSRYGASPAFYRDAAHGNRAAFYVFESLRITDWSALDQVSGANIVLAQTTDTSRVAHFGGMYTYDGIAGATAPGWQNAGAFCKANGLVWAPSVAPGYVDDRAVPGNTTPTLDRANGAAYDQQWNNALSPTIGGDPSWVSVTSFNEWHEGSIIEPASSTPPAGFGYQSFEGAYGQTGAAAETAYLDRTAYWAARFDGSGDPGDSQPPTVPGGLQVTGRTSTSVSLAWNASTDNVGVTGYRVMREAGDNDVEVAAPSGTSATVTGLAPATSYTFYTLARDGAGNTSAPSGAITVSTDPAPSGGNLARHRPISASSATNGYPANRANDGDAGSYWESANHSFPQWLQVDLGSTVAVRRIVLRLPPSPAWGTRTQTLSVLTSTDGASFSTAVASAGYTFNPATGNTVTIAVPAVAARYLRLSVTANTGWPAAQAAEFEAYTS
jgi:hypothetical protein